jgi:hypothetical protein
MVYPFGYHTRKGATTMTDHFDSTAVKIPIFMREGERLFMETLPESLLETIAENGLDALPEAFRLLLNAAMLLERQKYLAAAPYERSPQRRDQANGFKDKTVHTRMGSLTLAVPQVRKGDFYPAALERGLRSERALKLALAEMYVQGLSTRKVAAITEQLCGYELSAAQVSQAPAQLDAVLPAWRNRALGAFRYVYLDARYESVRIVSHLRDVAVLIALGVAPDGKRHLLGVCVSLSGAEVHWRTFLKSLVERGLGGVQLVISDDHAGLKAAAKPSGAASCGSAVRSICSRTRRRWFTNRSISPPGRRHSGHFQCHQSPRSRATALETGHGMPQEQSEAGRLAGGEWARRLDGLCLPRGPSPPAAHDQRTGAGQPGSAAAHARMPTLSQRGLLSSVGFCGADGDQRRVGDRQSLPDLRGLNERHPKGCTHNFTEKAWHNLVKPNTCLFRTLYGCFVGCLSFSIRQ